MSQYTDIERHFGSAFNQKAATAFWKIVQDCLVQFHGKKVKQAKALIGDFKLEMAEWPPEVAELTYHEHPFKIACDLAGSSVSLSGHEEELDGILDRHIA